MFGYPADKVKEGAHFEGKFKQIESTQTFNIMSYITFNLFLNFLKTELF